MSDWSFTPPTAKCPKHGAVYPIALYYDGERLEPEHCMKCYIEWVAANVTPVVSLMSEGKDG